MRSLTYTPPVILRRPSRFYTPTLSRYNLQHTSAYVSMLQHTSAYVKEALDLSIRQQERRDAVDAYYCVIVWFMYSREGEGGREEGRRRKERERGREGVRERESE
jgi:hypothetical protein